MLLALNCKDKIFQTFITKNYEEIWFFLSLSLLTLVLVLLLL
jgi:hypothetical protein